MIWKIAKKEVREITRSGQFTISLGIVLLLMMVATLLSYRHYQQANKQYEGARISERNIWESQDNKNPHSAAHYGTYAFKPKYPLSLIDPGVDRYLGISVYLEAHKRNEAQFMAAADQTGLSRFGSITPDFVLLFLIPLFIILIGHNVVSKEHEKGTLRLVKSQGVSMRSLVAGKWLGMYALILGITGFTFLMLAIFLSQTNVLTGLDWGTFGLMFFTYLIYYAIFNSIVLIGSIHIKHASLSLVSLLAIWMITCLALPKASTTITDLLHPYPTQQQFTAAIDKDKAQGLDGHTPWSAAAKKLEKETLKAYKVSKLEDLPFNYDGYRMQKGEEHEAKVYFEHYKALRRTYQQQKKVYNRLSVLSPYLPVRFLSMSLAHTDYGTHWHFLDAAEKYRLQLQKNLNGDFAKNSAYGNWAYKADKSLWAKIPRFSYSPPKLGQIIHENTWSIVSLFFWFILSMAGFLGMVPK
ncbi:DUF3526 domain-containing protein [uncultured Microscilla sp.]|uniref:ABC transporter permease n=1 Tax=uncultured Microscilla sp. TaxID=432653 RepID=UPI0026336FFA|nr:DUF3526 domain-containing protein [uncultured Microscilla sp.]